MSWFTDVVRFHHKMDAPIGQGFDRKTLKRRRALMDEEWKEVCEAIRHYLNYSSSRYVTKSAAKTTELQREVCAELVDLIYVTLGTFVELGIDPQPVWAAIHAANMQKEPNPDVEGGKGKAVKPEGWQKPRIVLRSFAGVVRLIVGSHRNRAATLSRQLNVPGAAQHARALAVATTEQSTSSRCRHGAGYICPHCTKGAPL